MATDAFNEQVRLNMETVSGFAGFSPLRMVKEEKLVECAECKQEVEEIEILRNAGICAACTKKEH